MSVGRPTVQCKATHMPLSMGAAAVRRPPADCASNTAIAAAAPAPSRRPAPSSPSSWPGWMRAALGALDEAGSSAGSSSSCASCVPASWSSAPNCPCRRPHHAYRLVVHAEDGVATSGGAAISSDSADERRSSAPMSGAASSVSSEGGSLSSRTCLVLRRSRFEFAPRSGDSPDWPASGIPWPGDDRCGRQADGAQGWPRRLQSAAAVNVHLRDGRLRRRERSRPLRGQRCASLFMGLLRGRSGRLKAKMPAQTTVWPSRPGPCCPLPAGSGRRPRWARPGIRCR
jgi:hypothetical protein